MRTDNKVFPFYAVQTKIKGLWKSVAVYRDRLTADQRETELERHYPTAELRVRLIHLDAESAKRFS